MRVCKHQVWGLPSAPTLLPSPLWNHSQETSTTIRPISQLRRARVVPLGSPGPSLELVLILFTPGGQSGGAASHRFLRGLELLSCQVPVSVTCLFFLHKNADIIFIFYVLELNPRFWMRAFVSKMLHLSSPSLACLFTFFYCIF